MVHDYIGHVAPNSPAYPQPRWMHRDHACSSANQRGNPSLACCMRVVNALRLSDQRLMPQPEVNASQHTPEPSPHITTPLLTLDTSTRATRSGPCVLQASTAALKSIISHRWPSLSGPSHQEMRCHASRSAAGGMDGWMEVVQQHQRHK